jgi:putative heme-binding domain-containing protein
MNHLSMPPSRLSFRPICFIALASAMALAQASLHAAPEWIWIAKEAKENEAITLRKAFEVPGAVRKASLTATCDNFAKLFINGKAVGDVRDWKDAVRTDVRAQVRTGRNEIKIEAKNREGIAAAVAVIEIELTDGRKLKVETSADWEAAPAGSSQFKPAAVLAKYGDGPWGDVFSTAQAQQKQAETATAPATLKAPPGFTVELLYTVPKADEGSWVALTVDPKGRLIAADQYGGLYRVTVPPPGMANPGEGTKVEPLKTSIGGAHGLLYAFDSLYVMVNERDGRGLWRLRDTDGDDQFDSAELLRRMNGGGEHGTHQVVLGPDGKSLYFANGNHTELPEGIELSRAARAWGEDHAVPRMWDANGHAKGKLAPGGYICKTDPDGRRIELISYGYRNQFDIAFDTRGELFTFDSDMEWDMGTPWYRPTKIAHATSGSDHGWRSGSGKWPDYYPDSLPPTLDVGPGSPTGMVFGTGARFPAKYQRALYAADWTYGTMYAIHLTPDGASFRAEKEEFLAGKPLPLTDMVIHPQDGAMYFAIGGRRTQSALYRIRYGGGESTAPAAPYETSREAKLRHELERLHEEGTGAEAIEKAWPHLGHPDRWVRYAARVAIERQPVARWADRALAESQPQAAIEALVALARMGDGAYQGKLFEALGKIAFDKLSPPQRLAWLRVWQLSIVRQGKPKAEECAALLAKLEPLYPSPDLLVTRELAQVLVALDSAVVAARTVPLLTATQDAGGAIATDELLARNEGYARAAQAMAASRPNRQAIALAFALRSAKAGWTPELRRAYFAWFPSTAGWKGGNSFSKFIDNIRTESLANFVPESEKAALDELSKKAPQPVVASGILPKGPGRAWTVDEVVALAAKGVRGRDFERGKAMYAATLCAACHKFAGEGGNVGPDLTGSGNRYTIRDLAESILEPSKVISDQYGSEEIHLKDGSLVVGRVVVEENGKLFVMTNPLAPDDQTAVDEMKVAARKPYPISMMPPGLIHPLNAEELLDLIAYLQSGGNPSDAAFAQ